MSQINYTYNVTSVDNENGLMTVEFSSEGLQTIESVMRVPYAHENTDWLIKSFAPLHVWDEMLQQKQIVEVGTSGVGSAQTAQLPTESEIAVARRDTLLIQSDWTQLADVPMTTEKRAEWATYRQALRDITAQDGFPTAIEWPTSPL